MPAYECPKCGGGFPESPDSECPWCGLSVDGSYLDDLPGRPASDLFGGTPAVSTDGLPNDGFLSGKDLPPSGVRRSRAEDRMDDGGDE
jgi:hypothetical protein